MKSSEAVTSWFLVGPGPRAIGSGGLAPRRSSVLTPPPHQPGRLPEPSLLTGFYPSRAIGRLFLRGASPLDAFRAYPLGRGCPAMPSDNR